MALPENPDMPRKRVWIIERVWPGAAGASIQKMCESSKEATLWLGHYREKHPDSLWLVQKWAVMGNGEWEREFGR